MKREASPGRASNTSILCTGACTALLDQHAKEALLRFKGTCVLRVELGTTLVIEKTDFFIYTASTGVSSIDFLTDGVQSR